jgi:Pyridine nucleotide-disulphide oxidoreductase
MQCRAHRLRRQRECHPYFARRVTFLSCADGSIILLDGAKRILPSFAESLSRKAARRLGRLGVRILTEALVEKVDHHGVIVAGRRIESATVLWTAGVAPAPILKLLNAKSDRAGRVCVMPFLSVPDHRGGIRRRRRCGTHPGQPRLARCRSGSNPGRPLCRAVHRRTNQGSHADPALPVLRQRQHGCRRQEFCRSRNTPNSAERGYHLVHLDVHPSDVPATAAKSPARRDPVALVLYQWSAQLATDSRGPIGSRVDVGH